VYCMEGSACGGLLSLAHLAVWAQAHVDRPEPIRYRALRVDFLVSILTGHYSLDALIQWGGYLLLVAIVFAETGLLIGCFLPGDSLLITAAASPPACAPTP